MKKETLGELKARIEVLSVQLEMSIAAERAWETSMMRACGEDGPKSVADKFAALYARCAALAAELQSVKAMNDCLSEELRGYESDGAFEGPKMHLLWWQCETPNHDAFLAEVRAIAIEHAASERWGNGYVFDELNEFAAQLRKGAAS